MRDGDSDVGRFGHTGIDNVVVACHTWYAGMVASPPASAADVTASWQSRFRPTAWPLTRLPTVAERRAFPGGFFSSQKRDERGRFGQVQWWRIAPPVGLTEAPEDSGAAARETRRLRRLRPQRSRLASDAGGLYLAIGKRRIRDSFIAARTLDPADRTEVEIIRFIEALMPRSRGPSPTHPGRSSHKRREPVSTARMVGSAARGPRRQFKRTCEITVLDVADNIPSVKVALEPFIDNLHLAKLDGRWSIVNVLYEDRQPRS